jgi:hypothetical protein
MFNFVEVTSDLFLQPMFWNMVLTNMSSFKLYFCNHFGFWGLLFDDQGLLMERCFQTGLVGAQATYLE